MDDKALSFLTFYLLILVGALTCKNHSVCSLWIWSYTEECSRITASSVWGGGEPTLSSCMQNLCSSQQAIPPALYLSGCAQDLRLALHSGILTVLRGLHGMPGIKPMLVMCQASAQPLYKYISPAPKSFLLEDFGDKFPNQKIFVGSSQRIVLLSTEKQAGGCHISPLFFSFLSFL